MIEGDGCGAPGCEDGYSSQGACVWCEGMGSDARPAYPMKPESRLYQVPLRCLTLTRRGSGGEKWWLAKCPVEDLMAVCEVDERAQNGDQVALHDLAEVTIACLRTVQGTARAEVPSVEWLLTRMSWMRAAVMLESARRLNLVEIRGETLGFLGDQPPDATVYRVGC